MDARGGLNGPEADRKLRDLFAVAGPLEAPEGLEQRILGRLAVEPKPTVLTSEPLLPRSAWIMTAMMLFILLGIGLAGGGGTSAGTGLAELPADVFPKLAGLLSSTWTLMALTALAVLTGLETLLLSPRRPQIDR